MRTEISSIQQRVSQEQPENFPLTRREIETAPASLFQARTLTFSLARLRFSHVCEVIQARAGQRHWHLLLHYERCRFLIHPSCFLTKQLRCDCWRGAHQSRRLPVAAPLLDRGSHALPLRATIRPGVVSPAK